MQQVLDLSCCRCVGDAGIAAVAAAGARLHTLSLSSCHQLTDAAFAALGARCGALAHLNACGCELLGDAGLAALAAGARCWPSGLWTTTPQRLRLQAAGSCGSWPRWPPAPGAGPGGFCLLSGTCAATAALGARSARLRTWVPAAKTTVLAAGARCWA